MACHLRSSLWRSLEKGNGQFCHHNMARASEEPLFAASVAIENGARRKRATVSVLFRSVAPHQPKASMSASGLEKVGHPTFHVGTIHAGLLMFHAEICWNLRQFGPNGAKLSSRTREQDFASIACARSWASIPRFRRSSHRSSQTLLFLAGGPLSSLLSIRARGVERQSGQQGRDDLLR